MSHLLVRYIIKASRSMPESMGTDGLGLGCREWRREI